MLASVEWDAAWQRHHAFAARWAEAGHRVFFVENTGIRAPGPRDLERVARRLRRALLPAPAAAGRRVPERVEVVSPLVAPPTGRLFREANAALFAPRLADQLHRSGLGEGPVVFAYLPTATTLALLDELRPSLVVYDCVDNFYGLEDAPADLAATETALMARAGLVLTTSRTLYEDKRARHPNVLELHHGVGPAFFIPPPPPREPRRFCYFGTLWRAVDYEAVRALGEAGFDVDLIGPVKEPTPPLPERVRLKGAFPHDELPGLLGDYDGLLLPYVNDEYNRGVIPAKTYECLATGRPVLASPLPALRALPELSGALAFAGSPAEWAEAARAVASDRPEDRERRLALARAHAESAVFGRLADAVDQARAAAAPPPPPRPRAGILSGLGWIGLLYGLAKGGTLLTQVLAGRWMGPREYGLASLVFAAAAYLQIPPMLGFPIALSKLLALEDDEARRARFVSTTLAAFGAWLLLTLPLMLAAHHVFETALGLPASLFALSVLLAAAIAVYTTVSSPLLGLRRFAHRGLTETFYGLSAPIAMALVFAARGASHDSLILALAASLAFGSAWALFFLRRYLVWSFDPSVVPAVLRFAFVATLNLLAAACVLAPGRMLLNRWGTPESVGVFSAYFTATIQIALAGLYMMQSALIPLASDERGQREGWAAFRRWAPPLAAAAFAGFLVAGAAALALFGRRYPLDFGRLAIFAGAAALVLAHGAASALLSARDLRGLWSSVAGALIAGLGNFALAAVFVPGRGVDGAGWALLCSYAAGLAWYAACAARLGR